MAKERAEGPRRESTHARGRNAPKQSVSRTLAALARKAESGKKHRFKSLYGLIDLQMLYESFGSLKRGASPGVDGVTVAGYEKSLDENLRSLHPRLKAKRYWARRGSDRNWGRFRVPTALPP